MGKSITVFKKTVLLLFVLLLLSRSIALGAETDEPSINAASAVVIDFESGRLLYEKNAHDRRPMASTTKIMTAIVAMEHGILNEEVTVSRRAAQTGGSGINLRAGEKYTLKDLLYGLLIRSGNDAAVAIAEHVAGSVEGFAKLMNHKAWLLGARNTRFVNPHGLDTDGHYTTAYDMAVIARYALQNELFSEIVSTRQITVGNRQWQNTNEMLELYPGADGVKTGYTGKAGRCLVTSATREGRRLVSVVLFCSSRYQRADNSRRILDYAFENYSDYFLADKGVAVADLPVSGGKSESVEVRTTEIIKLPLREDEYNRIEKICQLPKSIDAPVYAGLDVGSLSFMLDGEVIAQTKLKTWNTVEKKKFVDYFLDIIRRWLGIFS